MLTLYDDVFSPYARKVRMALYDPYRVKWRSERLEWVIKNGSADWFMDEIRAGRAFFPLPARPPQSRTP